MHRTIEISVPTLTSDELVAKLQDVDGVIGLARDVGASLIPSGDVITVHALNRGADGVMGTVAVNPAGETPLTRDQVWQGLERKARDARLFLPPGLCTRCDVTEERPTHFVREATIAGQDVREIIVLEAGTKVTFFQATGPREGAIVNELFEDEAGELQLRFYCYLGLRGKAPGGSEEQAEQAQFDGDSGYKAALLSTLKRTRELLADGTL